MVDVSDEKQAQNFRMSGTTGKNEVYLPLRLKGLTRTATLILSVGIVMQFLDSLVYQKITSQMFHT
jgi:hypothetical protein